MNQYNKKRGFTLIELMLSMTFVTILLLTIALTVIRIGTLYNSGMTLKAVNQSSRDIADDLRRSVAAANSFEVPTGGADTNQFMYVRSGSVIMGGRLCLGSYSYVWNTGKGIELPTNPSVAHYLGASTSDTTIVRLAKVPDAGMRYCEKNPDGSIKAIDITASDALVSSELLPEGDRNIAVQSLSVTSDSRGYDGATGQRLYRFEYTLGAGPTSSMNETQTGCLPPDHPDSNITYCNVQQFKITLRNGSTVN